MADGKKGGLFSGLNDKLHEIAPFAFEDDGSKPAAKPAAPAPTIGAPQPSPPAYPPQGYPQPPQPQGGPYSGTVVYPFGTSSAAEPVDEKTMGVVSDGVFKMDRTGQPSTYMRFMKMWEALGKGDPAQALKAMQAMDPSITPARILQDIDGHLHNLDGVRADAAQSFAAAEQDALGGADAKLKSLNEAQTQGQADIDRIQKEIAARTGEIQQVTSQRVIDEQNINRAKARTEAAEASVQQTLEHMRQVFTSLPQ